MHIPTFIGIEHTLGFATLQSRNATLVALACDNTNSATRSSDCPCVSSPNKDISTIAHIPISN
jgi:hypothetical protein